MRRLGLIAGGGGLPVEIANHCRRIGRPLFVVRLQGFAGPELSALPGADAGIAELGKIIAVLKANGCEAVCLAGIVARPNFATLIPDRRGLAVLPRAMAAAARGDDALLRVLVGELEGEGFLVEGAHQVVADLTLPEGALGRTLPSSADLADAFQALEAARAIGRRDVGQAAIVRDGHVLATEGAQGTDALLASLPEGRGGVLAKAAKPIQDLRVDLPVIGPATIRSAARARLSGVVGEAGRLLVLDRQEVVDLADREGLFVLGVRA